MATLARRADAAAPAAFPGDAIAARVAVDFLTCRRMLRRLIRKREAHMGKALSRAILAVLAITLPGGCGTLVNFEGVTYPSDAPGTLESKKVYGGVQLDLFVMTGSWTFGAWQHGPLECAEFLGLGVFCLADLPFSFLADTATLPITVPASLKGEPGQSPPESTTSPVPNEPPQRHVQPVDATSQPADLKPAAPIP